MKWKRILKWLLALFLVGVVGVVIVLLSLDSMARWAVQKQIETQTGIKTRIGHFHIGLLDSSVTMTDLKLYNPPAFGGTLFLEIPEIHAEIDQTAIKQKHELHLALLRFNLGELDIVKNADGQTNIFALGMNLPSKDELAKDHDMSEIKKRTGFDFTGIDKLSVSVGTAKYIDLGDAKNNHEQNIGLDDIVIPNVKSPADLTGLIVLIALRSDNFFTTLVSPAGLK
jgi:hypothetical protein